MKVPVFYHCSLPWLVGRGACFSVLFPRELEMTCEASLIEIGNDGRADGADPRFLANPIERGEGNSSWLQQPFVILRPKWKQLASSTFRWQELSGALGDLGTFIPLTTYLAATGSLNFGSALICAGLYNLSTILYFDIPIAVQPMHTISSVAAASQMSPEEIMSAGLFVASCVLFLGMTNLITLVSKYVPTPIVQGIQLGLGVQLISKGLIDKHTGAFCKGLDKSSHCISQPWFGWDSIIMSLVIAAFFLLTEKRKGIPAALIVFL